MTRSTSLSGGIGEEEGGVPVASQPSGHQPSASALRASQSGVPNAESERAAVIAWLRRRSEMASDLPPVWKVLKRARWRWTAATFDVAARLIERGAHHSDLDGETQIIRAAIAKATGAA